MILVFDVDGTLCETHNGNYKTSEPLLERIQIVNSLFDDGDTIRIATARGAETGMDWRQLTEQQLKRWGVRYHSLSLDKPYGDVYVDDKATLDTDFFKEK